MEFLGVDFQGPPGPTPKAFERTEQTGYPPSSPPGKVALAFRARCAAAAIPSHADHRQAGQNRRLALGAVKYTA
ncbi:hypothetical protein GCM10020220_007070 [Nonomuraea rubra]|uniref:hypothetical protein n=1 Tax=Nonomuraea rubra TaxID=46180 RepID=UPI0031E882DD